MSKKKEKKCRICKKNPIWKHPKQGLLDGKQKMLSQVCLAKTMTVQDPTEKFLLSIKTLPYWVSKNNHFYLDVNVKTSLEHDSDRLYYLIPISKSTATNLSPRLLSLSLRVNYL